MTNFITTFKAKAHSKSITAADMIALCIYKTMKAKSEDKAVILKHFLKKAFSAGKMCGHRLYPYQAITNAMYGFNSQIRPGKRYQIDGTWKDTRGYVLSMEIDEVLEFSDEQAQFRELAAMITPDFVRVL